MNRTVTWRITFQPWQVNRSVRVNLSRATYSRHGRQEWDLLKVWDAANDEQLVLVLLEASAELIELERQWRAEGAEASAAPLTEHAADPVTVATGSDTQREQSRPSGP